jgi:hypothetical protein
MIVRQTVFCLWQSEQTKKRKTRISLLIFFALTGFTHSNRCDKINLEIEKLPMNRKKKISANDVVKVGVVDRLLLRSVLYIEC